MEKIFIIITVVCLFFVWYGSIWWERKKCKRQFEILSDYMNQMLNQKPLSKYPETLETLPSKIYHQLTRLQEIYFESQQKMSKQQEDTQRLITEIAHQLRNPLMNIQNYLEILEKFELDEKEKAQYLQAIRQSEETASNDAEATNPPSESGTGENGANTEPQDTEDEPEDKVIIPQGKMKVTVICDGSLNIRRSAAWGNENICGRAIRGQSYYVKEIHVVDGKKMVRTIGDLYLSGESEHVQFEQL